MLGCDLVMIFWMDASAQDALEDIDEEAAEDVGLCQMVDVGWIIKDKPEHVVVAGEGSIESRSFRHVRSIAKVNIQRIELLTRGRRTRKYDIKRSRK